MALTDSSNGMIMPVAPTGGFGGGFGGGWGDGIWLILLVLFAIGGNGFGFGGFGGGSLAADGAMLYPWMNQSQQVNDGFRDQMLNGSINQIQSGVNSISTQLCNGFSGVNATVNSGFANAETAANARQIANMQQAFDSQTAVTAGMNNLAMGLQNCCCENRASIADLKYTVATENCADRQALNEGVRDIIASQTAGTQRILDQMCNDKIDAKNEKIADLERQLSMATLRESQVAQNAFIAQGFANEVDQLYNRLSNCPVPSTPVYGRTPIFTCQNGGCGCGM